MRRALALAAVCAAALTGCAAPQPPDAPATSAADPTEAAPPDPIAGWTLEQRVGQLFLVGTPVESADPVTLAAVADAGVAGVFLHGRSSAGATATAELVAQFTSAAAPGSPPLWVATDQEGGDVQVLGGAGFEDMPTALTSTGRSPEALRVDSQRWAEQLRAAGVTMNLAPVVDIVTSPETEDLNLPVGVYHRHYGYDQDTVTAYAGAFAAGMRAGGILPTLKHFPGLGRVTGNTDYAADVVDTTVDAAAADVAVYRALLAQGPAVVMMATAVYDRIDPARPAAFSAPVVTGLLREQVGFEGVVMTDDLSAPAQVEQWPPGDRAVMALEAGVDLLLVSADPSVFPQMHAAVLDRARADPVFARRVDESVRRILALKSDLPVSLSE